MCGLKFAEVGIVYCEMNDPEVMIIVSGFFFLYIWNLNDLGFLQIL